jgi:hypothetical protein
MHVLYVFNAKSNVTSANHAVLHAPAPRCLADIAVHLHHSVARGKRFLLLPKALAAADMTLIPMLIIIIKIV